MRRLPPPPRGLAPGTAAARVVGAWGLVLGVGIIVGVATGKLTAGGDPRLGYCVGAVTAAYGLLRVLRRR